jgi:hypothetical protein
VRRLVLVLLVALACGPVGAHAQSLALAYRSGDAYKYTLHSTAVETVDAGVMAIPITLDLTAHETVTVQSVDSAGAANLSISVTNLTIKSSANGVTNTTTGTPAPIINMKVAADGRILSVTGNPFGSSPFALFSGTGGSFTSAVLPDNAVKPGDTWSKSYDQANTTGSGNIHVTTKSKYLRDEAVNGVSAAVVQTTSTASINITIDMSKLMAGLGSAGPVMPGGGLGSLTITGTSSSDVTTWIDPGGHRVLKSHMTGTTDATMTIKMDTKAPAGTTMPGMTGPYSIKGTQTLNLDPA